MANLYSAYSPVFENNARTRVYYTYSQNQANNTTTVYGSAYYESDSPDGAVSQYSLKIRIYLGGQTIYLETANQTIPYYNNGGRLVGNFSKTFTHNSDGTIGEISIQGYGTNIGEYTNTVPIYPPFFARYSYFTSLYVVSTNLTQATIHWEADSVVGYADYNINGGAPIWASGPEFTVSNLQPNTTYTIKVNIQRLDSGLWYSQNINVTTKDIARVTGGNNITDEQNPYMTFSNPSGAQVKSYIEILNPTQTVCIIDNIPNTGNYTFALTEAQKNLLYTKCQISNSTTIRYGIVTKINGTDSYWSFIDRTITIVNANPIFNNFDYVDINLVTKALTNNEKTIVKGYSNIKATISEANKAIAQKNAIMGKYMFITGSKTGVETPYASTGNVELTINGADGNVLSVYAVDSRNNSTKKDIPVNTLLDYWPINIQAISAIRGTGGIGTEATLNFNGDIWNNNFGEVQNSVVSASYKFKKTTDTEWITGTTNITPTLTDNSYSKSVSIAGDLGANGFNSAYSYNIEIEIKDKLSTTLLNNKIVLQSGKPQQAFGIGEGVAFGNFYDTDVGGVVQAGGALISYYRGQTNSFDTALTHGEYKISSETSLTNAPYTGAIHGKLIVLLSDNTTQNGVDNWIWQTFISIDGMCYNRRKIDAQSWSGWSNDSLGRSVMCCVRNRAYLNHAVSWTTYNMGLSSSVGGIGDKLIFTTNGIKIGSGVRAVMISAMHRYNGLQAGGDKVMNILKNGVSQISTYDQTSNNGGFNTSNILPYPINVTKDDLIQLGATCGGTGNMEYLECYLTVEVIG
jgi:hypothetical protein